MSRSKLELARERQIEWSMASTIRSVRVGVQNIPISEQLDIGFVIDHPYECVVHRFGVRQTLGQPEDSLERLLRAKWKDCRPVPEFASMIKTLVLGFDMFHHDVQLSYSKTNLKNSTPMASSLYKIGLNFESGLYSSAQFDTRRLAGLF